MPKKLAPEAIIGLSIVGLGLVIFTVLEFIMPKQPNNSPGGGAGMPSPTKNVVSPQPQPQPPFTQPQTNGSTTGVPFLPNNNGSSNPWDSSGSTLITAPDGSVISVPVFTPPNTDQSNMPTFSVPDNFETLDEQYINAQNGNRRR